MLTIQIPLFPRTYVGHFLVAGFLACLVERVAAQAPVNDIVSWPSGMLLLVTVLYAGIGSSIDNLWASEPSAGLFLFDGLPVVNLWGMNRVFWTFASCHFVSRVRPAVGRWACWVPAERVSQSTRDFALRQAQKTLSCVTYSSGSSVSAAWVLRSTGLLSPVKGIPLAAPSIPLPDRQPTAHDFLLFAAIGFHVEWELDTTVYSSKLHNAPVFTTRGSPWAAIFDVDSIEMARIVVAANMARRQFHQSRLRALAILRDRTRDNTLLLNIDAIDDTPVCTIDFHSYAPSKSKVSATLRELAEAYYVVVQYIKATRPTAPVGRPLAQVHCNGSLWTAILGGAFLDNGRLTVENLDAHYMKYDARNPRDYEDRLYSTMVHAILEKLQQAGLAGEDRAEEFNQGLENGGISRVSAGPFLVAGIFSQALVCYFLSVGTSAGIWTSVAMANALFARRLSDLHSAWCSRRTEGDYMQPGLKMRLPESQKLMAVATLNRSAPAHGSLRPGFLLNTVSIVAAILGNIFQRSTRRALGFSAFKPAQTWVLFAAVAINIAVSSLVLGIAVRQWINEKSWRKMQDLPMRIMVLSTVPASFFLSALALFLHLKGMGKLWPILDATTFVSGLPLGMIENGGMIWVDENIFHLALLNRWVMGAVGSSLGRGLITNATKT